MRLYRQSANCFNVSAYNFLVPRRSNYGACGKTMNAAYAEDCTRKAEYMQNVYDISNVTAWPFRDPR